nr:hypothetical protein [Actinoplanes derwentensis]
MKRRCGREPGLSQPRVQVRVLREPPAQHRLQHLGDDLQVRHLTDRVRPVQQQRLQIRPPREQLVLRHRGLVGQDHPQQVGQIDPGE